MAEEKDQLKEQKADEQPNSADENFGRKVGGFINQYLEFSNRISKWIPKEIFLNRFKIPKISFPKLDFPVINYNKIEKIAYENSKQGWTLTAEIGIGQYLNDELLHMSPKEIDNYFFKYYAKNDWERFKSTKKEILAKVDPRWNEVLLDCFEAFEQGKYRMTIPTLFTIIEGETAAVYKSNEVGTSLARYMYTQVTSDHHKLTKIAIYSLSNFMRKQLFIYHEFTKYRKPIINRNWVLHGRDDPKHWKKVDAVRLFNVLSTIQLVKDYKDEIY